MKITFDWSEENIEKVKQLIEDFAYEYEVTCAESVQQCDEPNIDSPILVGNLLEVVITDYDYEEDE